MTGGDLVTGGTIKKIIIIFVYIQYKYLQQAIRVQAAAPVLVHILCE